MNAFPRMFLAEPGRREATDEDFRAYLQRARDRVRRPQSGMTMAETLIGWAVHLMLRGGGGEEPLGRTTDDAAWLEQQKRWSAMAEDAARK